MSDIGHNRGIAGDALRQYVDRVERLEEEKKAIAEDIKQVYVEIKAAGFDIKIVREVVRRRKMTDADREDHDETLECYEGIFQ